MRQAVEKSGAYLFLPDGDAVSLHIESTVVNVIKGPIISSVIVQLPYVKHIATLYNSIGKFVSLVQISSCNLIDIFVYSVLLCCHLFRVWVEIFRW